MMNIAKSVAFTGHRPDKIFAGHQENSPQVQRIKQQLEEAILRKIEEGCTCFLSGMAMGADLWAGEIVLQLKKTHPQISLVAAVPFAGQSDRFPPAWQARYDAVLKQCDEVAVLSESYYKGCFQARNQWLLEHSEHLIAVFNGSRGGTMQTLNDALLLGHDVIVIRC